MNMRILAVELTCRGSIEFLPLADVTYIWGEIKTGKSTVARLIDYCLGGKLVETPAIQEEFVACTLYIRINGIPVSLHRERDSNQVIAVWEGEEGEEQVVLPVSQPDGVRIPDTRVEILSDFLFYLSGIDPPKVRKSREREDSELKRLSFRNLLWYCYLDQDHIDSNFFHLGVGSDTYHKLDSKNVLRFILGLHQERVAEYESKLDSVRKERSRLRDAADALSQSLSEAGFQTAIEIEEKRRGLMERYAELQDKIGKYRESHEAAYEHATERLRKEGQVLAQEVGSVEDALSQLRKSLRSDREHLREIQSLSTKIARVTSARAVLRGVEFDSCPRCASPLPERGSDECRLCGQAEPSLGEQQKQVDETKTDLENRVRDLNEFIELQEREQSRMGRLLRELADEKAEVDEKLNEALKNYDSAYLSNLLEDEKESAALHEELRYLEKLAELPRKVEELRQKSDSLSSEEERLKRLLKEEADKAGQDRKNLKRLCELFLDSLVRARVPEFSLQDEVRMGKPHFFPEVQGPSGEMATSTFDNIGSGGAKTIFKCCFAVAVHRLVNEIGGILPRFLIIDSPMKNISERENKELFEGFHDFLYEMAETELSEYQFVLIDKECHKPHSDFTRDFLHRHVTRSEPLISSFHSDINEEPMGLDESSNPEEDGVG